MWQINLPFGAVTIMLLFFCPRSAKNREPERFSYRVKQFDIPGTFLLIGAMICLMLVLQYTGTGDSFSQPQVFGVFIAFVALFVAFMVLESRLGDMAAIPLRLFKNRTVGPASLLTAFLVMAFYM